MSYNIYNRLKTVKAIFFDFSGTLYELNDLVIDTWKYSLMEEGIDFDKGRFYDALRVARLDLDRITALKVNSNQIPKMPSSYWTHYHSLMLRNMGVEEKKLLTKLSLRITRSINNIEKKYKINKNIIETLEILKQKYKIGLISNTSDDYRRYLIEDRILHLFDVIGLSFEIGSWKPDKKIFWKCCKIAQENPQNCVYVGDTQICDLKGSLNAGMIPILIKHPAETLKISEDTFIPIKEISELQKYL